jgi:hypothetical protein
MHNVGAFNQRLNYAIVSHIQLHEHYFVRLRNWSITDFTAFSLVSEVFYHVLYLRAAGSSCHGNLPTYSTSRQLVWTCRRITHETNALLQAIAPLLF